MPSYIVVWAPVTSADRTVDKMKVIDAWSSSEGIAQQRAVMKAHIPDYSRLHGVGYVRVLRSDSPGVLI